MAPRSFHPGSVSLAVPLFPDTLNCMEVFRECMEEPQCQKLYLQLEYCVDEDAVTPLGPDPRHTCLNVQNALAHYRPLQECKCQRGSRMELRCLRVYWTVRFPLGELNCHSAVDTSVMEDSAVDTSAIEDSAVDTSAIEDSAEDTSVIEDSAEDTSVIEDSAVDTSAIEDSAVDTSAIEDSAEDTSAIEDSAEDTSAMEDSAEDTSAIEDSAEDTSAIEDSAEDTTVIEDSAEDTSAIEDSAEDTTVIEDSAEDTSAMGDSAVDTSAIEDSAVDTSVVEHRALDTSVVEDSAEDTSVVEDRAVDTSVVEDRAVDTSVVEDRAVDTSAVEDSAEDTSAIEDSAVDTSAVEDRAVDTSVVEDRAVDTSVVEDSVVDTSVVEDRAVDTSVVEDRAVDTSVVEDSAENSRYDDIEMSPYEDIELELVRNAETSKLASIVAVSSFPLDGQNRCLKAAQDCGLFEKCGALRSEYVLACTKPASGSDHCNRQKCHRALRRFLDRVPEEYSFGVLFCSCTDPLCGERRRKTIVPSCSYEERDGQPNCLQLENYCLRDDLCRSRLADFQQHCQPSSHSPSGCLRDSGAVCLKAYAGLIGTIMTPNYVSNSSTDVSQWCNCESSGNKLHDCLRILHMFTNNACLRNAIDNMGSPTPWPVEGTPLPPPRPSPHLQHDELNFNLLPDLNSVGAEHVEESEEHKVEEGEEEMETGEEFNVIPPFSEKAVVNDLDRVQNQAWTPSAPLLLFFLLLLTALRWG
ncbi:hypothetical protein P4O66_015205 [Electrophorus voltai]|uniref:GDNF/GAS1 domain-containing protein n=1 Tax=Electrophorus voltai TaxID=2609070 RepID=A0AAD9DQS2_9TELE|nr:hypothetical protein P4O66_015205 [Electrophorus voltai]